LVSHNEELTMAVGVWDYGVEQLNDLYSSPNIVRMITSRTVRLGRNVACMGEKRGSCRVLVKKQEGKRRLGTARRRWNNNIKLYLQDVGWGHGLHWSASGKAEVSGLMWMQ